MEVIDKKMLIDKQASAWNAIAAILFVLMGSFLLVIGVVAKQYTFALVGFVPVVLGTTLFVSQSKKNKQLQQDMIRITIKTLSNIEMVSSYRGHATYVCHFTDGTDSNPLHVAPRAEPGDKFYYVSVLGTSKANARVFLCKEYELDDDVKSFLA